MLDKKSRVDSLHVIILGAKICGPEQIEEALKTAKRLNIGLERAILILKYASEDALAPALEVHTLVNQGKLTAEEAVSAVIWAKQNDATIAEAIARMGIDLDKPPPPPLETNPLTEFMLEGEVITKDQLANSIAKAKEAGLPLARAIVLNRYASRKSVLEAIALLKLVREEKITRENASSVMRQALAKRISVWQVLFESGIYTEASGQSLRLGELLAMAQVVSESDLMDCFEAEVLSEKPLSTLLLERKCLDYALLDAAHSLLDMVQSYLKPFQAAQALRQVKLRNISVYQALAELDPPPQMPQKDLRVGDLLVEAGVAKRDQVEKIVVDTDRPVRVGKKLLDAKLINEAMLYNVLRCQSLFKEGLLNADQTVTVLRTCVKTTLNAEEALAQHGLAVPVRMQWSWT
ncbi:MAG TPA: hypothetical protein V6D17_05930 [Candidatus Obscuribacterales bacterium]